MGLEDHGSPPFVGV